MSLYIEQMNHYTNMIGKLSKLCQECIIAAQEKDTMKLSRLVDNRERLLQIIKDFNFDVSEQTNINFSKLDRTNQARVRKQIDFIQSTIELITEIDEFLTQAIEDMKDQLKVEIGTTFQSAQKLSGYNLNNLKR